MFAAVKLGVFDALNDEATADELASRLGTRADTLRRLLDACAVLGLLERDADRYRLTAVSQVYLTKKGPLSLIGYIDYSNEALWSLWGRLEDAVREGGHRWEQVFGGKGPLFSHYFRTEETKRAFLLGMHGYGTLSSPRVVDAFDLGRFRKLVDLGGATGHLAMAACARWPELMAVVLDLPEVVPIAREFVQGVERVEVAAGDFFRDPLPEADLFALGRILHDWDEARIDTLLRTIVERLPRGGGLLIAETLLDEDGPGPRWSRMQDLNMMCVTEGRERTLGEYTQLLKKAGFQSVEGRNTGAPLDAILALRA